MHTGYFMEEDRDAAMRRSRKPYSFHAVYIEDGIAHIISDGEDYDLAQALSGKCVTELTTTHADGSVSVRDIPC